MKTWLVCLGVAIAVGASLASCAEAGGDAAPGPGREEAGDGEGALTGKLIFEDRFDGGLESWQPEGNRLVEVVDGRLHVKTEADDIQNGQYVWCRKEHPVDFRIEYDFTPTSKSGFFLIFFCAKGVKGEDILSKELLEEYMPAKSWKDYHDFDKYVSAPNRRTDSRINCYHVSYRRNENANCNFRKNVGLNLLVSRKIDAVLPAGETFHVVLAKKGANIKLTVDGKVFMDHNDDGKINGGVYGPGRVGLRQVYESEGYYDNFRIYDLTGVAEAPK